MKGWKAHVAIATLLIASVAILLAVFGQPVVAQVRAALVRDVDNAARQPFSAATGITNFTSGSLTAHFTLMTVPPGKRAVIEHCSCVNFLDAANSWIRFQLDYVSGVGTSHQFVHTLVGTSLVPGTNIWSFSQPVRLYADPSTELRISAIRRTSTGLGGVECYVSGHFVDLTP